MPESTVNFHTKAEAEAVAELAERAAAKPHDLEDETGISSFLGTPPEGVGR